MNFLRLELDCFVRIKAKETASKANNKQYSQVMAKVFESIQGGISDRQAEIWKCEGNCADPLVVHISWKGEKVI